MREQRRRVRLVALSAQQRQRRRELGERDRRAAARHVELLLALRQREHRHLRLEAQLAQHAARRRELRLAAIDQQAVGPRQSQACRAVAETRAEHLGDRARVIGRRRARDRVARVPCEVRHAARERRRRADRVGAVQVRDVERREQLGRRRCAEQPCEALERLDRHDRLLHAVGQRRQHLGRLLVAVCQRRPQRAVQVQHVAGIGEDALEHEPRRAGQLGQLGGEHGRRREGWHTRPPDQLARVPAGQHERLRGTRHAAQVAGVARGRHVQTVDASARGCRCLHPHSVSTSNERRDSSQWLGRRVPARQHSAR